MSRVSGAVRVFTDTGAPVTLNKMTPAGSYLEEVAGLTGKAASDYKLAPTGDTDGVLTIRAK